MNNTLVYSILEILGVLIFASEGLFVKDIELHPFINVLLAYTVYAIISFIILKFEGKINFIFLKQLTEPKFFITNIVNILKTGGLFVGFKYIPVSLAIVVKMMGPAFILVGDSILNNNPMNMFQIIGIISSILTLGLIYIKPITSALKNVDSKFFIGIFGVLLYNIMNAYNVIRLPEYVTDKNPHEEVFLSTGSAFLMLISAFIAIITTNKKLIGDLHHINIIKMMVIFVITCYIGMSLTYEADNHLEPTLFSVLQYSQLFLAFIIGYLYENEKFPISKLIFIGLFLLSVGFTMKFTQKPKAKDKRKIITNATLFHSEQNKSKKTN